MAKTELTDKQKAFLDALFDDAEGDYRIAMTIAGYDESTKVSSVINPLSDEIVARAKNWLASNTAKAAIGLIDIAEDPNQIGTAIKLKAVTEILDRSGITKIDKSEVEITATGGVFILPAKN